MNVGRLRALAVGAWLTGSLAAQQNPAYERAFDLERRGNFPAAAEAYRALLVSRPAEVNALLGLERVLQELGKPEELAPPAARALASDPRNPVLLALAVRGWAAAQQSDSVRAVVLRWLEVEPGGEAPFREWGFAALVVRDRASARTAYEFGRERLGRPDALAGELAQLSTLEGDIPRAVAEWLLAVRAVPGYRASALGMLSQMPTDRRPAVLAALDRAADPLADQLSAALAARWGEPANGFDRLMRRLPTDPSSVTPLQEFLEEVRTATSRDAAVIRARTLEAIAGRIPRERARWVADAARAYAAAGDQASARRMLAQLAGDPAAPAGVASSASSTLVGVLIGEGRLADAEERLAALRGSLTADEAERLTHELARGFLKAGTTERALSLVATDSSVDGTALRGRARLLRGDLRGAAEDLAAAGPFAGERAEATDRAQVLALLQVMDADSLPALGQAFLTLERGDSAGAAGQFLALSRTLPPPRGGAELLLLAARLTAAGRAAASAEPLFRQAAAVEGSAAAPAARLELGRLLARLGRESEAVTLLEQLILDFPASATAPQARRLIDAIRGGVPPA